jgi:lipopolysaccharide export system protein LptC
MSSRTAAIRKPVEAVQRPLPVPPKSAVPHNRPGRLARVAKIALPLVALGIGAVILAWSHVNLQIVRLQISDSELAPQEADTISMVNPRFAGVDAKDRSFNVIADVATQQSDTSDLVHLQNPHAEIVLSNDTQVAVHADAGQLQRSTQILDLSGAVNLVQSRGYKLHTTKARIDLGERTAVGDAPVEGSGPHGEVTAEGFQIFDQGTRVIFLGHSHAVFKPQPDPSSP